MEMIDLRSEGPQANTGARHPPTLSTPGESAVMFGVIIPVPLQKIISLPGWSDPSLHSPGCRGGDAWALGRQHSEVILTVKTTPISTKPTSGKLASAYQDYWVFFTHSCTKEPTPACCAEGTYLGCSASFSVF